jgi:hypothetical protein
MPPLSSSSACLGVAMLFVVLINGRVGIALKESVIVWVRKRMRNRCGSRWGLVENGVMCSSRSWDWREDVC